MDIFKEEGNQIVIKGLALSTSAMKAVYIASVLHKKMPRKFDKPDFKYYPLREWLVFREDLEKIVRYTQIQEKVAVFMNGKWIGSENDLLIALKPYLTFVPDMRKYDECVTDDQMQLLGVNPQQSLIYFDFAIEDEVIGRVFYEIYSEAMPNLTRKFVQLCKHDPVSLRKLLNPTYTESDESLINEKTRLKVFDPDDPEAFRDGKMDHLSYLDTYITRIVPQSFFQAGKIVGVNEWIDGELERDMLPHTSFGDISLACKPGRDKRSELISLNEFIISFKPNPWMNGRYRCIGRLVHGQDVLEKIQDIPNHYGGPLVPVMIHNCGVIYSPFFIQKDKDKEATALEALNEANEEEQSFLKSYKELVYAYYNELCELESSLNNNQPEKDLEFYYNIRDTLMSPYSSEYIPSENGSDSVKYDDMEQMSLRHTSKLPYNLEVYKSVAQTEALGVKLYKFLRPVTLEELLLEEKYLDGPDLIEHDLFFQCELADSSLGEGFSKSSTDFYDSVDRDTKPHGEEELGEELYGEGEEEIIFGPDEGSEEFMNEQEEARGSQEEPISKESSPHAAQHSSRSSSLTKEKSSNSLTEEESNILEETTNVPLEDEMGEMEGGEFEGEEGDNIYRFIAPDKYTLPDYVTPAYLLEMAYEPNLIPRQILEYIFESVIKPKAKVNLDGDVLNVMRTDNFQTALKSLPSEKLRNIAMQMEGVRQDLMEMEKNLQDEEALKKEDELLSSCLSQFTQNMLEFYLRELYVHSLPGESHTTKSKINEESIDDEIKETSDETTDGIQIQSEDQIDKESVQEKGFDIDHTVLDDGDAGKESTTDNVVQKVIQQSNEMIETPQQSKEEMNPNQEETEDTVFKSLEVIEDEELEQIKLTDSELKDEQELVTEELEVIQDEGEFEY